MQKDIDFIFELFVFVILIILAALILFVVLIINQRKYKFSKQLKFLNQEHQKTLLQTQLEIQEQTFAYIAREIHDHIGQRLTLARLYLNSRKEKTKENEEQLINDSSTLIEMAIADLKHLSRTLTADFIRDNGLLEALNTEINHINKMNETHLQLTVEGDVSFTDAETELVVFRIIQEALQNILKHSKAMTAEIKLVYTTVHLQASVSDNGNGFNTAVFLSVPKNGAHSGIANMKKRVEFYKGTFQIESAEGKGTCINFKLPIKPLTHYA